MWPNKIYYVLKIITFLINCNTVEMHETQNELYKKIYISKNVNHNEISRRFSDILHAIYSTRKHGTNGQEIELAGTIIILRKVENHKNNAHSKDRTTDTSYISDTRIKISKERKNVPYFRKPNRKNVLIIVDSASKRESFTRKGLSIEDTRDFEAESKNKQIVHLKSNILRDKYADACMKVAVRKCYKALMAVNKNICKVLYRCKSTFKSYFKNKSKTGCIKEFDYTMRSNSRNNKTMLKKKRASVKFGGKKFVDATREGYLDACIPYMVPKYKLNKVAHKSTTLRNDTLGKAVEDVLRRSRSERKCQRLTRDKCVEACHFAVRESCAKYDCSRRWKKAFGKACKEECKRAYQVKITSDSSDTSGSY